MSIFGGTINNSELSKVSFFKPYTPKVTAITGTVALVSSRGRYLRIGKLTYVELQVNLGTVGGGSVGCAISLPLEEDFYYDSGTNQGFLIGREISTASPTFAGKMIIGNITGTFGPGVEPTFYDGTTCTASNNALVLSGWYATAK